MELKNESKTLFIPLLGKAKMSEQNLIIKDTKAEEIINKINYDFSQVKNSKYLSMYMALRARILDNLVNEYINNHYSSTIIHLGCGLDSRVLRVNENFSKWYDVDYKEVIDIRKEFYKEDDKYQMISSSILDFSFLDNIKENNVLIIMEGVSMYLNEDEMKSLLNALQNKFKKITLILDSYSKKAVKLSKIKNPINKVNAKVYFGMNNYNDLLKLNNKFKFVNEYDIEDKNIDDFLFNHLYTGKFAKKLYKIYKFKYSN
jgi:O-methyltransferase involved in polyketide biosynthesis